MTFLGVKNGVAYVREKTMASAISLMTTRVKATKREEERERETVLTGKEIAEFLSKTKLTRKEIKGLYLYSIVTDEIRELLEQEQAEWWHDFDHEFNKAILKHFWEN